MRSADITVGQEYAIGYFGRGRSHPQYPGQLVKYKVVQKGLPHRQGRYGGATTNCGIKVEDASGGTQTFSSMEVWGLWTDYEPLHTARIEQDRLRAERIRVEQEERDNKVETIKHQLSMAGITLPDRAIRHGRTVYLEFSDLEKIAEAAATPYSIS